MVLFLSGFKIFRILALLPGSLHGLIVMEASCVAYTIDNEFDHMVTITLGVCNVSQQSDGVGIGEGLLTIVITFVVIG